MTGLRTLAEVAIGLLYAVGAAFNALYTVSHGAEFYGGFAEGAWLRPAGRAVERLVVPHATGFTVALIAFQISVAAMILSRGDLVTAALVAGAVFSAVASLVSSPGGTIGNLALTVVQGALALAR